LAAFGVPAIYLALTPDHEQSAAAFVKAGMGLSLGVAEDVTPAQMVRAVKALLGDPRKRKEMRAAGLMTLDGRGAARVGADIAELVATKRSTLKVAV
ncbi:MAG TPA: hypothetical protein VHL34_18210, partial [Rhizomicrobium sp.]|nr:hypothetical protein [Rhizomicrobium sp.]